MDYRQKNWPEWLILAEFAINKKIHSTTKVSLFMENYRRELKIGINIRKNRKMKKAMKFAERMKKVQEEAEVVLKKTYEVIKWQADRGQKKAEK